MSAPGIRRLGINRNMAGRGGRNRCLGFTTTLATAMVRGAPGIGHLGHRSEAAGRGGRNGRLGFIARLATAVHGGFFCGSDTSRKR
jgi:hypothetical protein